MFVSELQVHASLALTGLRAILGWHSWTVKQQVVAVRVFRLDRRAGELTISRGQQEN